MARFRILRQAILPLATTTALTMTRLLNNAYPYLAIGRILQLPPLAAAVEISLNSPYALPCVFVPSIHLRSTLQVQAALSVAYVVSLVPQVPLPHSARIPTSCVDVLNSQKCIRVNPPPGSLYALAAAAIPQGLPKMFPYDYVFSPQSTQESVYDEAANALVERFLEGFNVTILAYGQTSSGKTYTMGTGMEDRPESEGLVPRAINQIFEWVDIQNARIKERNQESAATSIKTPPFSLSPSSSSSPTLGLDRDSFSSASSASHSQSQITHCEVKISYLEVYNEELIDLLAAALGDYYRPPIVIREDPQGHIIWSGVKEVPISSASEAFSLLKDGSLARQTGYTGMNEKSSRSHAIFSLHLIQHHTSPSGGRTIINSKFHFVDLAGSERLKKTPFYRRQGKGRDLH